MIRIGFTVLLPGPVAAFTDVVTSGADLDATADGASFPRRDFCERPGRGETGFEVTQVFGRDRPETRFEERHEQIRQ